ncbi:hypothetical protein KSW81_002814 [Nannochloris sp. 'desiccata']|nr:hypothetical protein KSW81_002814 [Chlorella desiccata (nom. nud.)]
MVLDFLHRRAVAAVTVDAPASLVWEVLTDYDHLADFIPNLAASERIKLPPSAPANVVRVRQGKWMLSEGAADPELAGAGYTGPQNTAEICNGDYYSVYWAVARCN